MKRKKTCEDSEQHVLVSNGQKKKKKTEANTEADTKDLAESCVNEGTKGKKKKLQTEAKTQKAEEHIAKIVKNKKKKKTANLEATDAISLTDSCVKEVLDANNNEAQTETEESNEMVSTSEPRKNKKRKKDATDNCGITESCLNDEESEKFVATELKKKKKKKKKTTVDLEESGVIKEHNGTMTELQVTETKEMGEAEKKMNEDELSPEERRVFERKLKKILRKEEKNKQKMEEAKSKDDTSKSNIAQTQALEYLTCWSKKKDEWKFQKTRQVWLLQHMYDSEKVSDSHFTMLLEYIEGLRGVARETTAQKAEALVRFEGGQEEKEDGATNSQTRTNRAREVIQILS